MLTFLFIICVFLGIIIVVLRWNKVTAKLDECLKRFPGPPSIPILANALQVKNIDTLLQKLVEFQQIYGDIYGLKLGPTQRYLVLTDHKILEYLLKSQTLIAKADLYKFFDKWMGRGLVQLSGEKWKTHRRILNPAFHLEILEKFPSHFDLAGNILIQKLAEKVDEDSIEIYEYMSPCMLDIIFESTMGTSVNAQDNPNTYLKYVNEMCRISVERGFSLIKMFDFSYQFTKDYQFEQKATKVLLQYSLDAIKNRKVIVNTDRNLEKPKRFAFLDTLLSATVNGQPLPDEDIRAEINVFTFAGHETTATAISFAMYCLAQYPKEQEKVMEELRDIFADDPNRPATYEDLQKMKYTECVIKETLRLYPPVPFVIRQLEEDVEYDGEILPKNLGLFVFIFAVHRNPKYFPDPDKFDPERFTAENSRGRNPYCYIPFSAGPRNCIGQRFAMLEMKSILSKVLRHFEVLPAIPEHKLELCTFGMLRSSTGLLIRLKKRKF